MILKNLLEKIPDILFLKLKSLNEKIIEMIQENINNHKILKEKFNDLLRILIESIFLEKFKHSLLNTFNDLNNISNRFSKNAFNINLNFDFINFDISFLDKSLIIKNVSLNYDFTIKKVKVHRNYKIDEKNKKIILYFIDMNDDFKNIDALFKVILFYIYVEIKKVIRDVYFLPASRSGLYQGLNAFSQIIAELSKNRSYVTKKIELPAISEPVADYFLKLSEINATKKTNKKIAVISSMLEKDLLKGEVSFDSSTKKILYKPDFSDIVLNMEATSSMVAEISPIVLYLKHVISLDIINNNILGDDFVDEPTKEKFKNSKPLIFIEEPEAHLHPEAQAKLIEMFAKLAENGVKLMITSHSNYMFNKLNNLILDKKIDKNRIGCYVLKLTDSGSVAHELKIDEFGVDDQNFSEIAEELYNENLELLNKFNKND
ncbi:MAG: hypothetical protein A2086_16775 [Spirochaetes bacterium GWD1_27_9]|nr:MAG: hypothetical protein A2086_16775 [Spirochaetes bacterium GWD1_27_9]